MTLTLHVGDRVDIAESVYEVDSIDPKNDRVRLCPVSRPRDYMRWVGEQVAAAQREPVKVSPEYISWLRDSLMNGPIVVSTAWMTERGARVLPKLEVAT